MNRRKDLSKIILISLVLIMVLAGLIAWFKTGEFSFNNLELSLLIPLAIIILFAAVILLDRIKSYKKNLTAEDELSKKIKMKAGNASFLISLYIWLVIYYIHRNYIQDDYLFGIGIMAMALTYAISYVIYLKFGKVNE